MHVTLIDNRMKKAVEPIYDTLEVDGHMIMVIPYSHEHHTDYFLVGGTPEAQAKLVTELLEKEGEEPG